MKEFDLFQPRPEPTRHFGDFSEGLRNALLGNLDLAKIYFTMAADLARRDRDKGYEKYYQALIDWIDGDLRSVKRYSKDADVMYIGKKSVLDRLIRARSKEPDISFAAAYKRGQFYGQ